MREDHIRLQSDKILRKERKALHHDGRKPILYLHVVPFRPSASFEPLPKCLQAHLRFWVVLDEIHQHADASHVLRLLCQRWERPTGSHATKEGYELAPSHPTSGAGEQRREDSKAERLGGLEIDDQFELSGKLNRQIARFGSLQDLVHISGSASIALTDVDPVVHQTSVLDMLPEA